MKTTIIASLFDLLLAAQDQQISVVVRSNLLEVAKSILNTSPRLLIMNFPNGQILSEMTLILK